MTTPDLPDFRALSADLLVAIQLYTGLRHPTASEMSSIEIRGKLMDAVAATVAALATPPPEPPTSMEILELSSQLWGDRVTLVRAALERWGK